MLALRGEGGGGGEGGVSIWGKGFTGWEVVQKASGRSLGGTDPVIFGTADI